MRAHPLEQPAVQKAAVYRYNSLVEQQTLAYPWLRRMVRQASKSVHGGQGTVNEVVFEGITTSVRIALKVVYQRGSSFKSAERSLWLNVDNHPHILPLLFTAGPHMLFMPYMELASVTDWLAKSIEAKALSAEDLRLVHQIIGLQVCTFHTQRKIPACLALFCKDPVVHPNCAHTHRSRVDATHVSFLQKRLQTFRLLEIESASPRLTSFPKRRSPMARAS